MELPENSHSDLPLLVHQAKELVCISIRSLDHVLLINPQEVRVCLAAQDRVPKVGHHLIKLGESFRLHLSLLLLHRLQNGARAARAASPRGRRP